MKIRMVILPLALVLLASVAGSLLSWQGAVQPLYAKEQGEYYCPMHPDFKSDKPGSCPICGMDLMKKPHSPSPAQGHGQHQADRQAQEERDGKKVKFYRHPHNPWITSHVPMKDEMGMDYVPVYEETGEGIFVSPERQQMIGVVVRQVQKRRLHATINAVGQVAYDPGLFVAQEEYLQAVRAARELQTDALPAVKEQASSLVFAARQKLLLMGMNDQVIKDLAAQGEAQKNLYLPVSPVSWVYVSVYEYEIGMVEESMAVEVTANAYPGQVFKGKAVSIFPIVDSATRSLRVRVEVEDPQRKLKPEMFVNALMVRDLGEKLAVPEEAVLDTGIRKIVYVKKDNAFQQREIKTGVRAEGYYEVIEGLREGEEVVTSGNFLIDSESRMRS